MNDHSNGFVKLLRSETTREMQSDPLGMHLLTVIACRARYSDTPDINGLTFGQARIGDYKECGMTRKQYRCAIKRLERRGLVKFVPSRQGTIATLLDSRVFSLKDERKPIKKGHQEGLSVGHLFSHEQLDDGATERANAGAVEGPSKGHQGATNQKEQPNQYDEKAGSFPSRNGITAVHIYEAYPKKVARKQAITAIAHAMKIKDPEVLLERVRAYASAIQVWPVAERIYVPNPATWFNQGRYDDDPTNWARARESESPSPEQTRVHYIE